jgi:hypothetical protein
MIQVSRRALLVGAQSVVNIFLAGSLYNEYVHNRFMQDYLASALSATNFALPVGLLASAAIAGSSLTVYTKRHRTSIGHGSFGLKTEMFAGSEEKLAILDTCPFCNLPLKNLSDTRFQCRKCRRYFKK